MISGSANVDFFLSTGTIFQPYTDVITKQSHLLCVCSACGATNLINLDVKTNRVSVAILCGACGYTLKVEG